MRKRKIAIKPKAIMLSTKGKNKHLLVHLSKKKGQRKACMRYTLYGRHVQSTKQSKQWTKRKIAKQNSKNKSKGKQNIHLFQNSPNYGRRIVGIKIGNKDKNEYSNMDENMFINTIIQKPFKVSSLKKAIV